MDSLRTYVTRYIDPRDARWVESLVDEHGLEAVLQACAEVLADGSQDEMIDVAAFLRDIGLAS